MSKVDKPQNYSVFKKQLLLFVYIKLIITYIINLYGSAINYDGMIFPFREYNFTAFSS